MKKLHFQYLKDKKINKWNVMFVCDVNAALFQNSEISLWLKFTPTPKKKSTKYQRDKTENVESRK